MTDQQVADLDDDHPTRAERTDDPTWSPAPVETPRWRRGRQLSDGSRLYWFKELAVGVVIYLFYETIRNRSKSMPAEAFDNAVRLMDWQQALGINHEKAIQDWSLNWLPVIIVSNYYYGIAYVACTIGILVWLYRKHIDDYPLWRNTLAIGTLLGLVGFATFPLMPPRLLDVMGGGQAYGFVDTLVEYPTFWSFESSAMQKISNQFAAMPSLHCGWALWGMAALLPRVRSRWAKALAVLYPITTIYVVVATGNHYFLDAVGGAIIFVVGYGAARLITRAGRRGLVDSPATADA
jgi:hypothetical protein